MPQSPAQDAGSDEHGMDKWKLKNMCIACYASELVVDSGHKSCGNAGQLYRCKSCLCLWHDICVGKPYFGVPAEVLEDGSGWTCPICVS